MPERGRRHRVEHVETVDTEDIPRFGALGVVASLQPYRGNPEPESDRSVAPQRRPRSRLAWLALWQHLAHRRTSTFGSDWPAVPLNPMLGLHTAVTRTTPDGPPEPKAQTPPEAQTEPKAHQEDGIRQNGWR